MMKKKIILSLILSSLLNVFVYAAEYAEVPLSVIMENRFEDFDQKKPELEITLRDIEAKDKEIIYLKNQIQKIETENKELKKVKTKKIKNISKEEQYTAIEEEKDIELNPYTNIIVKGGIKLPSTVNVQEAEAGIGIKADIEYIKGDIFLKGLELGGGIGFEFLSWENDNTTTDGAIVVGENIAANEAAIVKYETSIILIPMYMTAKYRLNMDNKILNDMYFYGKMGYNLGIGGDVGIGGSICYGLGFGKKIGKFGAELEYVSNSFNADYSKNHYPDSTMEKEIDITNSKIALNITYSFDF